VGTVGALAATAWVLAHEALARTRAQAERVVVWVDRMTREGKDVGLFLYIRNDSTSPIVAIHVDYSTGAADYPVIGPGQEIHQGLDRVVSGTVEYTDIAGRRWRRSLSGSPPKRVWRRSGFSSL
jgi:hypothetical protein